MKFDERIAGALKSKQFFIICLLKVLSTILLLVDGNLSVLDILLTIFLWMVYTAANRDLIEPAYIRRVSGVIFAQYIINYVLAGLLLFIGVLLMGLSAVLRADPALADALETALESLPADYAELFDMMISAIPAAALVVNGLAAGMVVLFNVFYTRTIHRFVQSCYQRLEDPQKPVVKISATRKWLMVTGTICALESIFMFAGAEVLATMSYGTLAAAYILGGITIKQYLED